MTILDFIPVSADSILRECTYSDGSFKFVVETEDMDTFELIIKSKIFYIDIPEQEQNAFRTFFVDWIKISDFLQMENEIFTPKNSFADLMKEKKKNLNLAYGLNSNKYPFLLSLVGSQVLFSAVVSSVSDIVIRKV